MQEHLQDGEQILHRAHPTRVTLLPLIAAIVLLVVATLMLYYSTAQNFSVLLGGFLLTTVGLVYLAWKLIVLASFEYVLTDRRVIRQMGILNKTSVDSYLDKINNVEHRQTVWGRILGYGDVEIDTASESGTTVFRGIAAPLDFKRAVVGAAEEYRSSRLGGTRPVSGAQKIRELKALLDDGLISQEEFEAKRKQLLETM